MEKEFLEELKKNRIRKIRNALIASCIVILIAIPAFTYFRISREGHFALREAKNIKLAYQTLVVEYYGDGKSIYNPTRRNGMSAGVEKRLQEVTQNQGDVCLLEYDKTARKVKAFTYEAAPYRVIYRMASDGSEEWSVEYIFHLQHYGGDDL